MKEDNAKKLLFGTSKNKNHMLKIPGYFENIVADIDKQEVPNINLK